MAECQDNHISDMDLATGKAGAFCGNIPYYWQAPENRRF
jgi:hypothetical protein